MTDIVRDTLVTFDVAADDGSGFTDWAVELPHADADRLAEQVAKSDPGDTITFCNDCPNKSGAICPHGAEHIRVIAIGNLRLQPLKGRC
jgi:hypothetical protein